MLSLRPGFVTLFPSSAWEHTVGEALPHGRVPLAAASADVMQRFQPTLAKPVAHEGHVSSTDSGPLYSSWVSRVTRLAQALRRLEPTAEQMKLPPAESLAWHGNLFQKLLPQLEK